LEVLSPAGFFLFASMFTKVFIAGVLLVSMKRLLALLVLAVFLTGCLHYSAESLRQKPSFLCPDGSGASSSADCPKSSEATQIHQSGSSVQDKGIVFVAQDVFVAGNWVSVKIRNDGVFNYSIGAYPSCTLNVRSENGTPVTLRSGLQCDVPTITVLEPGQERVILAEQLRNCVDPLAVIHYGCDKTEPVGPGRYLLSAAYHRTKLEEITDYKGEKRVIVVEDESVPPSSPNKTITLVPQPTPWAETDLGMNWPSGTNLDISSPSDNSVVSGVVKVSWTALLPSGHTVAVEYRVDDGTPLRDLGMHGLIGNKGFSAAGISTAEDENSVYLDSTVVPDGKSIVIVAYDKQFQYFNCNVSVVVANK